MAGCVANSAKNILVPLSDKPAAATERLLNSFRQLQPWSQALTAHNRCAL